MSSTLSNSLPLERWRGDLSLLSGYFETTPFMRPRGLTWAELVEWVAPANGPMVVADKRSSTYFVLCALKSAPLTGRTLDQANRSGLPAVGVQRSSCHTTTTSSLAADYDLGCISEFRAVCLRIKAAGITFVAYTTWSVGLPAKGFRARVVIPLDKPIDAETYERAHKGANQAFFLGAADGSGQSLVQQQGVWAVGPDRIPMACRWLVAGGVASVDALVALAPASIRPAFKGPSLPTSFAAPPVDAAQVVAAKSVFDQAAPQAVMRWAKAPGRVRDGDGRERAVLSFAGRLHGLGLEQPKIDSLCLAYAGLAMDPELDLDVVLDRSRRYAGTPSCPAVLFAGARDLAIDVVRQAVLTGKWTSTKSTWEYLATYHRRHLAEVMETTNGGLK
jgi:hypothetical protein